MSIWDYIKSKPFFRDHLPHIKSADKKVNGINGRGNPLDFSEEEKKQINAALKKMVRDNELK